MLCTYLQVSSCFEVDFWFTGFGLVDVHDLTCSDFEPAVWVFCLFLLTELAMRCQLPFLFWFGLER